MFCDVWLIPSTEPIVTWIAACVNNMLLGYCAYLGKYVSTIPSGFCSRYLYGKQYILLLYSSAIKVFFLPIPAF